MAQNIYDNQELFNRYAALDRSVFGLKEAPEWPTLAQMLPDLNGLNVIDLGCGYGYFAQYARKKGCASVVGLDISAKMLEKARELTKDNSITYQQQNLELLKLETEQFDVAFSSLAFHYIEKMEGVVQAVYKGLKPGSFFVFSVEHPIRTAPKGPVWYKDNNGSRLRILSSHQDEGPRVTDWLMDGVIKHHRNISTYLTMLINNGFDIRQVVEFEPTPEQIGPNPGVDLEKGLPWFVLVSCQKPSRI